MSPEVLDPVIHAQARLRIVAALAVIPAGDEIVFPRLRELLSMTAGNLSTHLSKLEAAGYVSQSKTFSGRTPATYIALTPRGRLAFEEYTSTLRAMLDAAGQSARTRAGPPASAQRPARVRARRLRPPGAAGPAMAGPRARAGPARARSAGRRRW